MTWTSTLADTGASGASRRERAVETDPAISAPLAILAGVAVRRRDERQTGRQNGRAGGHGPIRRFRAPVVAPPTLDFGVEPMAVRLAARLRQLTGTRAAAVAAARSDDMMARGNLAKADLYHAVSVILRDRDGVFSRMPRDRDE